MITWILYVFGYICAWPVQWIFFKRRVYYEDKKDTSRYLKGGHLIVSNHKKLIDFALHMFTFPFHKLYCLMSELIYGHGKFVSWLMNLLGGIRVDRNRYDFGFISKCVDLLDRGKHVIVYPEARIPTTKRMLPFYPSYIMIALKAGVPIVPTYTDGNYGIFKRTHIVIGKKINLRDYCKSENPTKEELEYLNKLVRDKILELEKLCKREMNKDKYCQGIHPKYLFRDMGRFLVYTMNIYFRVKVKNAGKRKKNLKIKGGGVIVANHQSFVDPLVLMCAFWRRRVYILAAEVVFDKHKIRAWLLKKLGCIRIDRYSRDFDAFSKCLDVISAGNLLIVFPSGQINREEKAQEFKQGAALLAHQANAPLYPVYINKKPKGLGRFKVTMGEKVDVNSIRSSKSFNTKDLDLISNVLMEKVNELEGMKE